MLITVINEMNQIDRHAEKLPPIVFIIDDDASMRTAVSSLIRSVGLRVEVFASAPDFLATKAKRVDGPSCLILDVRLPGVSGLEFQTELANENGDIPIIFITGHGDIPMSVKAMKAGAVEFLTKPFRDQDLLDAVQVALERARSSHESAKALSELRALRCRSAWAPRGGGNPYRFASKQTTHRHTRYSTRSPNRLKS
jgi:FixJ family two-component response regulator